METSIISLTEKVRAPRRNPDFPWCEIVPSISPEKGRPPPPPGGILLLLRGVEPGRRAASRAEVSGSIGRSSGGFGPPRGGLAPQPPANRFHPEHADSRWRETRDGGPLHTSWVPPAGPGARAPPPAGQKQEAVLKATAVRSPLPVMSSILPCPPLLSVQIQQQQSIGGVGDRGVGGRGVGGRGLGLGAGGRGHFIHLAFTALPHGASP